MSYSSQSHSQSHAKEWWRTPFRYYIRKFKILFGSGLLALFLTNACDILGPYIVGRVIDLLNARNVGEIYRYLFLLFGLSVGTAFFRYFWRSYFGRFHHSVAADLRHKIFQKMLYLGQNYHQKSDTGEKMTLLTEDVENFRMGIGPGLLIFADALIYVIAIIPLLLMINVSWTFKCLAFTLALPFVMYILEQRFNKGYRKLQDQTGDLMGFAQETVSGIKVIKSLSLQKLRSLHFRHTNKKLRDYGLEVDRLESLFAPFFEISIMLGAVMLMFVGAQDVVSGNMTIGNFFAFYQYLFRMIWPVAAFGWSFMMYKKANTSLERIQEVLKQKSWIRKGHKNPQRHKALKVSSLSFQYPDARTPTGTPTRTLTGTPTRTLTRTLTRTPTGTPTRTLTGTPTRTLTGTPTRTLTRTPTGTPTGTLTGTLTGTPTGTLAGTLVLKKISFELQGSQSMALVGSVGSGKSTLAQILARQIPVFSGQIKYDNQDIYEYVQSEYSSIVSLVPQDVFLFKKSILDNLLGSSSLNSPLSESRSESRKAESLESLKRACIYEEMQGLKEGLNTFLEENGQGLSGGQRQRLTLARGLLTQSQWLILDDSLSAVDIETEHKIIENLRQLKNTQKMNFIFCSHRIQSLNWVDQILVLDKGLQVDLGSHDQLIERCPVYQKLYKQKEGF